MTRSQGVFLVVMSSLLWSVSGTLMKLPTAEMPIGLILTLRTGVIAIAFALTLRGARFSLSRRGWVGALLSAISTFGFVLSVRTGSAVVATTIFYSAPVFAVTFEWFADRRSVGTHSWIAAVGAFVGVWLVANEMSGTALVSIGWALVSGASFAASILALGPIPEMERRMSMVASSLLLTCGSALSLLAIDIPQSAFTLWNCGWSVGNGLIVAAALFLLSRGMEGEKSSTVVSVLQSLEVPLNFVWPILADRAFGTQTNVVLGSRAVIGCLVIFGAALLVSLRKSPSPQPVTA